MGFDRYDDCLDVEETEVGQLALKRLSAKESYDRVYRIRRAMQLSLSHKILPKEQWTKMEEVSFSPTLYLLPVLAIYATPAPRSEAGCCRVLYLNCC